MLTFDPTTLPELIKQGYIVSQTHPTLPLTIHNYAAKTQYKGFWQESILTCRGLVLDANYQSVAQSLRKFSNHLANRIVVDYGAVERLVILAAIKPNLFSLEMRKTHRANPLQQISNRN
jgi:hypothetical protein